MKIFIFLSLKKEIPSIFSNIIIGGFFMKEYVDKVFPLFNDDVSKHALKLDSFLSYCYVKSIIQKFLNISVFHIERSDRYFNRINKNAKTVHLDNFFIVNHKYLVNIEFQRHINDLENLVNKMVSYFSHMMLALPNKGKDYEQLYEPKMIMFYQGSLDDGKELIAEYDYQGTQLSKLPKKLNTYIVQLPKINHIYQEKGIKGMNTVERISYVIQNGHKPQYDDIIKAIEKETWEVSYLKTKHQEFHDDMTLYLETALKEVNERMWKREFIDKGKNIGYIEGIKNSLRMSIKKIYKLDAHK